MEDNKIINLSFDDSQIKINRFDQRTIASVVSYFRADKLVKYMNDLGYKTLPDAVLNILESKGYKYDFKLNGYATRTTGIAVLDPRDTDDQTKANHIAMTKAKVRAYNRANRALISIAEMFRQSWGLFLNSCIDMGCIIDDEYDALNRVIETGYCNPDKK